MKKGLMIVVILAVLGVGGWFAYAQTKKDEPKKNETNNQSQTIKQAPKDPSDGGKYLVIKEWGVRFKKGANTQDLIYYYDPANPDGIKFGLSSLAQKYPGCSPEKTGLSLGLGRNKNRDEFKPSQPFTKIGDYFYAIGSGGAACLDVRVSPQEDVDLLGAARGELSKTVENIEEIH